MPKVFISYSHKDEIWKDRLQTQLNVLQMQGLLSFWEDRQIQVGDDWLPEIEAALNTADVAILLISAEFLGSKFIIGKEVPRLLERREREGIRVIPLIIKPCPWQKVSWLSALKGASRDNVALSGLNEHQQDEVLSQLAGMVHDLVQSASNPAKTSYTATSKTHSDRLPTVKGQFFGREAELQLLDAAWAGNGQRVIQFIAAGGTGKTKLLRYWLDQHSDDMPLLLAWSFYSQGASEDKQISATPFFSHAFELLGATRAQFSSEEDKGQYLAELLQQHCQQQCGVLVLDGLEPLQHAGRGMHGELKDRAIRALLRTLLSQDRCLCLITTRIAVHELSDRNHAVAHDLHNLSPADGAQLLRSLDVTGSEAQLTQAANEYGCHALALYLLGNLLRIRYQGDVRQRGHIKNLLSTNSNSDSRHAFKVLQAYQDWLAGQPALALLYLLGLFDHPIEQEVLQVLWDAQIANLTAGIRQDDWLEAVDYLREDLHLLAQAETGQHSLDCHPLLRQYFGQQLQAQQPQAWQQAHACLYEYYKALPDKELPDSVAEMQPLFSAVAHGCAAGLHQQALEEVYWPRIQRQNEGFLVHKLGAFSDDLATIAHFFSTPWRTPAAGLTEADLAVLLGWAGFCLRALGRLREALEPMQAGLNMRVEQQNWKNAATATSNLSQLQLSLGDLAAAQNTANDSVDYADRSPDWFVRIVMRTALADVLQQSGDSAAALALFVEAEQLQQQRQPAYPRLYSLQGFQYCDLLLARGELAAVLERAAYGLEIAKRNGWLLDMGLDQINLGRVHALLALRSTTDAAQALPDVNLSPTIDPCPPITEQHWQLAGQWLEAAVAGLRQSGNQDDVPRGLLARAALFSEPANPGCNFELARRDLQEVWDIAEPSGMRLFLTDYHLQFARLLLAEAGLSADPAATATRDAAKNHLSQAEQLIQATGYRRRLPELQALQQQLAV